MAERNEPIISFRDFSFQYRAQKRPTLTGIDLDIYPGERVLIAGPSGSGKSTLAGCINGLNPFSNPGVCTGTLTVDGVDAPHSSIFELSAHVGTVLQDPDGQFIGLTVGEALRGTTGAAAKALGLSQDTGSLAPGLSADIAIWNVQSPAELVNPIGFNPIHARYFKGQKV